jgi:hypothetical protein
MDHTSYLIPLIKMKKTNFLFFLWLLFFCASCSKDDIIKNATIQGNIRNNCTGSGFENVEVFLLISQKNMFGKNKVESRSSITNQNGDFKFENVDVHNSDKYRYALFIENTDHYIANIFGHTGLDRLILEKDKLLDPIQIGLTGSFDLCVFSLPTGVTITPPDTFSLTLQQRTLHYYEPERIWEVYRFPRNCMPGPEYSPNWGSYPMGWWHITFDKTKNGINSVINDSIYLGIGANTSYTIPW